MATNNGAYGANDKLAEDNAGAFSSNDVAVDDGPPKPASLLRRAADVGTAFVQGGLGAAKALTDVAGAGNRASNVLERANTAIGRTLSPERQAEIQNRQRLIKEAEGSGSVVNEVGAHLGALAEAPVSTIAQGAGSIIPTAAAALLTRGRSLLPAAGVGAAQGAGAVKGSIYDSVRDAKTATGASPAEAEAAAQQAQAYAGPNMRDIAVGGALGAVAGSVGAEQALAGAGTAGNLLRRVATGFAHEGATEGAQGGQERLAANLALQRSGFDVPTMQGVAGQAASEGIVGGIVGGGVSAVSGEPTAPPAPAPARGVDPVAASRPSAPIATAQPVPAAVAPQPESQVSAPPAPQSETTGGYGGGFQATPTEPPEPAPTPTQATSSASAAMGLNRNAGPISSAAATAVDTGATMIEQHRQIKAEADEEAKTSKPGAKTTQPAEPKPSPKEILRRPAAPVTGPFTAALSPAPQGAPADAQGTQAKQGPATPAGSAPTDTGAAPGTGQPAAPGTPSLPAAVSGAAAGADQPSSATDLTPKEPSNAQGREIQSIDPDTGEISFAPDDTGRAQAPADAQGNDPGAPAQAQPEVPAGQPARPDEPAAAPAVQPQAEGPADSVDAAAHQAATSPLNDLPEPTDGQKKAGNYRLGHLNWRGLGISIENPKGSTRSGTDADGKPWSVTMPAHYGYVKRTKGADGDHVDVYIGDHPESERVFVVDQQDAKTKEWDEHKAILGTRSIFEAQRLYDQGFSDGKGKDRRRAITAMTVEQFKTWLRDGDTAKPAADLVKRNAETKAPEPETAAPAPETTAPPEETAGSKAETAPKKPAKSGKPDQTKGPRMAAWDKNPFMTLLGRHGLYHVKGDRKSLKTEFSPDQAIMVPGYPPVFRYNGLHVDQLLVYAIQDGFLLPDADERDLSRLIERAIRGERIAPVYAEGGDQAEFEREQAKRGLDDMEEAEASLGDAPTHVVDALADSLDDVPDLWAKSNVSTEQAMRAMGFSEQEIQDEIALEQGRSVQADPGSPGAGQAAPGDQAEAGAQGTDEAPDAGAPGEGLTAPTPEEVVAKQEREAQALADEKAQKQAEQERLRKEAEDKESKARADATVDDFELGKTADQQLSGMDDLFSQPAASQAPEPTKPAEPPKPPESKGEQAPTDDGPTDDQLRDDYLRELRGLTEAKIKAYDPKKAVVKGRDNWHFTTIHGTDHSGLFRTRREAELAALAHADLMLQMFENPSRFIDITSERASKSLDVIKREMAAGKTEMEAGAIARREIPEDWRADLRAKHLEGKKPQPEAAPAPKAAAPTSILQAFKDTVSALYDGKASLEDYRAAYAHVRDAEAVKAELGKMTKDQLAQTFGIMRDGKKDEFVDMAYQSMLRQFALGKEYGPRTYFLGAQKAYDKQKAEALDALVAGQTDDDLKAYAEQVAARRAENDQRRAAVAKAIEDPKTIPEFRAFLEHHIRQGKTNQEARMLLTQQQRALMDDLQATETRSRRKDRTEAERTQVKVAGQTVDGEIIATKHTKKGHDLFVVRLSERVSREDYETLNAGAKRIGGYYSSFRGGGAIPGFQFTTREQAQAFVKLAQGDNAAAVEASKERRDAYQDDRSQSAAERLTEMADKMDEAADDSLALERKANTARRARFAAAAETQARAAKAMAKTMRNVAAALTDGKAKFLDRIRTRTQVELLQTYVASAKDAQLRAKYQSYAEQEKRKGQPPDQETADYAEFPVYRAYRSDLASLARQMLEIDGTKKLGQQLMKVADDMSDAFTAFAKEPGNLFRLSAFSLGAGDAQRTAIFKDRETAERSIKRSGLVGKAIVFPEKRGVNRIIMSPSEAIARGVWKGDGDKQITLTAEFGAELVEALGRANRRKEKVSVPWQFERAYERRKQLSKMGLETPFEFRAALREFIGLREQAAEADRIKELERAMIGKAKDGLDFFPTPEAVADEMIAAADIAPDMSVLEPSAGMGHIADRVRAAGAEPDVIELANDRRELLQEKGYHALTVRDFLELKPREFFTFGDVFRAPDGVEGIMHGGRGWSGRASLHEILPDGTEGKMLGWYDRDELVGVRHRGSDSGYDRIVMNPPFSDGRDIQHVRHAYDLLKPGGRLVALMGESAFTNQNKRATEFREWLVSVGGSEEKLPEGSFMDPSLPVNTGANARMVVIEKAKDVAGEPSARYDAREPDASYDQDLFGNPLPAPAGGAAKAKPAGTGLRGDVQSKPDLRDTPAPPGDYFVNTFISTETKRELGAAKITKPEHAAQATAYLYKSAVERFDGIVTDKDGKVLAVVGGFKGALAETSVYPSTLTAEAVRIPGAAHIWFSHNHPSGSHLLSRADERLTETLSFVFKGSGIEPMGTLAVTGDKFSFKSSDLYRGIESGTIPKTVVRKSVPVYERELSPGIEGRVAVSDPSAAKDVAAVFYAKAQAPGILLLDSQNRVSAWVPVTGNMMIPLKKGSGLNAIYRAISQANAWSAVIVHAGELDVPPVGLSRRSVAVNIGSALAQIDTRPVDIINVKTRESAAERGKDLYEQGVFARGGDPFYSALEREISGINAKAQPAMGWLATINGLVKAGKVKADEVEWSGLTDWLKLMGSGGSNPGALKDLVDGGGLLSKSERAKLANNPILSGNRITKEQVVGFLAANGVKVEEAVLSDAEVRRLPDGWRFIQNPDEEYGGVAVLDANGEVAGVGASEQEALADAGDEDAYSDAKGAPKYGKYTLPGGTNYREILLTLPKMTGKQAQGRRAVFDKYLPEIERIQAAQDAMLRGHPSKFDTREFRALGDELDRVIEERDREAAAKAGEAPEYRSNHWDQPNVLAHIRVNDRTDADGKRVLFVEEIQSDWAQAGKREGFAGSAVRFKVGQGRDGSWFAEDEGGGGEGGFKTKEAAQAWADEANGREGLPRAPFVTKTDAWVSLALKRVIKMAVDEGYDRVAFVTGEQSADRYDLSKQVDALRLDGDWDQSIEVSAAKPGQGFEHITSTTKDKLADVIGKELAQRALETGQREFKGLDLKVGGEGMRAFYDKIVPSVLKDVLRKLGGAGLRTIDMDVRKLPNVPLVDGMPAEAPGFYITPAMRARAADGLPLFERAMTPEQLRRAGVGEQRMDTARVQRIVAPLVAKWDVDVRVVATPADLPVPAPSDARGMHWNGVIYVVARTNRTSADVLRTLAHETIAHYGVRAMLGREGYRKFVNQIQLAARAKDGPLREISNYIRRVYVDEDGNFNLTPGQEGDEIAARVVELGVDPLTGEFKPDFGMLKAVFAKVMEFLRRLGLNVAMSNAELQGNLLRSMRRLERDTRSPVADEAAVAARLPNGVTVKRIGDLWAVVRNEGTGNEQHLGYHRDEQAARADADERNARSRLEANRAAGAGARWWIDSGFVESTPFGGLSGSVRERVRQATLDGRRNSVKTRQEGLGLQQDPRRAGFCFKLAAEASANGIGDMVIGAAGDGYGARIWHAVVMRDGMVYDPTFGRWFEPGIYEAFGFKPAVTLTTQQVQDFIARTGDAPNSRNQGLGDEPSFARAGAATAQGLANVTDTLRNLADPIGKVSLWEKTVGTQFHKATKDADFKRVFDAYLQQTDDTAHYAIEAESMAPDILMRLDSVVDAVKGLVHSGPQHKRDLQAVSRALFANIEGKEGVQSVRFDDDTLRIAYNLTPKQIAMYHQARAAVDASIDRLAQTYAAQIGQANGMDIGDVKNFALDDTVAMVKTHIQEVHDEERASYERAQQLLSEITPEDEAADETAAEMAKHARKIPKGPSEQDTADLMQRLDKIEEQANFLKEAGYMPAMRFGEYAVTVTAQDGEVLHFEMFESKRAANMAALRLAREYRGGRVEKSVLNPEQYAMFKGVSPETVELFAKFTGADQNEAYQKYIALARSARSVKMRELQRKGIAGFSEDATRVLAAFLTSNARQSAINMNQADITSAMASKTLARKGDVQREAQKLHEYMSNPREEAQALRGFMFFHFLGGSLASALVNLTQPVLQTSPYLAQYAGARTGSIMASAAKMAATGRISDPDLQSAAERAAADGITEPHEIHQLMADASPSAFGSSMLGRAAVKLWGSMFASAESFNRRLTFLAAYQVGKEQGMRDPYGFARKAVYETQGIYSKVNRPNWSRGAVGATLFTFKQFSISYMEWWTRLPTKQKALAFGLLILAAGAEGLPFADDIEDIIDTIGQSLGYNTNSKKALREAMLDTFGQTFGTILNTGLLSMAGADVSGRIGLGNLVPGTALFKPSEKDKTRTLSEFAGPLGGLVQQAQTAVRKVQSGEILGRTGAAAQLLPKAARDVLHGLEMGETGVYRDTRGYKVANVTAAESWLKALGLQPTSIAEKTRKLSDAMQDRDLVTTVEASIADRWAQGLVEKDADKVARARQTLLDWNQKNPETPIRINPMQIARRARQMNMDREARFIKTVPKELRGRTAQALQ